MKKIGLISIVLTFLISGCVQEEKSPIEGAWQMIYFNVPEIQYTFPDQVGGSQIKIWTAEHFAFAGQFIIDTTMTDNFGWGTYTIDGNKYSEHVILHASESTIGQTVRILIEVSNDTLTQEYPADENWVLPEEYSIEKYIRVK